VLAVAAPHDTSVHRAGLVSIPHSRRPACPLRAHATSNHSGPALCSLLDLPPPGSLAGLFCYPPPRAIIFVPTTHLRYLPRHRPVASRRAGPFLFSPAGLRPSLGLDTSFPITSLPLTIVAAGCPLAFVLRPTHLPSARGCAAALQRSSCPRLRDASQRRSSAASRLMTWRCDGRGLWCFFAAFFCADLPTPRGMRPPSAPGDARPIAQRSPFLGGWLAQEVLPAGTLLGKARCGEYVAGPVGVALCLACKRPHRS